MHSCEYGRALMLSENRKCRNQSNRLLDPKSADDYMEKTFNKKMIVTIYQTDHSMIGHRSFLNSDHFYNLLRRSIHTAGNVIKMRTQERKKIKIILKLRFYSLLIR